MSAELAMTDPWVAVWSSTYSVRKTREGSDESPTEIAGGVEVPSVQVQDREPNPNVDFFSFKRGIFGAEHALEALKEPHNFGRLPIPLFFGLAGFLLYSARRQRRARLAAWLSVLGLVFWGYVWAVAGMFTGGVRFGGIAAGIGALLWTIAGVTRVWSWRSQGRMDCR